MTVNLRRSLAVFEAGFAIECAGSFSTLFSSGGTRLPFHGVLIFLSPAFSLFGILFLWIGRHEWNELHRARVAYANTAFVATIIATGLAAAPIGYLALSGSSEPSGWVDLEFGIAVAFIFAVTFVTYALVAAHLVGRVGEVAMALGLGWATLVSAFIGLALMPQLQPLVHAIGARSVPVDLISQPIALFEVLLGFSYLAFFVAFLDAHHRVVKGRVPDGT